MAHEKSCGAVIFTKKEGRLLFLLIASRVGTWGFPKGHMEEGESETETALREIYEEVGIRPTLIKGFRTCDQFLLSRGRKQVVYFLGQYENQDIHPQETEISQAVLVEYEDAMKRLQFDGAKRVITEAYTFIQNHRL